MARQEKIYALYRGDEFIDLGTKQYLAELLNVKPETIMYYSYPIYRKRNGNNGYCVIEVEDEEEN